jgi:predicted AlkP superfamily pyrophosphatase or phosphodiesterase
LLGPAAAAAGPATQPTTRPTTATSPFITPPARPTTRPVAAVRHALVVSIDGLRPDLMLQADTPNLRGLMRRGAYTMWARTTPNAITLPSHVSMMTGVNPRRHDVEWNRDFNTVEPVWPRVPTLFEAAKRRGYTTAVAAGKSKFAMFDRPGVLDWRWVPKSGTVETKDVIGPAVQIIREHAPDVMLVHLPSVDNRGHGIGWASPEQMHAIEDADAAVGLLLRALDEAGIADSTFLIVTADHGGAGRNHGPDDPRSRHIPWIAAGPGVRRQLDLTRFPRLVVNTEDTFATACWMMGIPPTVADLDGVPVKLILERPDTAELLRPTTTAATAAVPQSW